MLRSGLPTPESACSLELGDVEADVLVDVDEGSRG